MLRVGADGAKNSRSIGWGATYERERSLPKSQINLSARKHAPGPIGPRLQTASEAEQISPSRHPETAGLKQPPEAVGPAAHRISPSGQLFDARAPGPSKAAIKKRHRAQICWKTLGTGPPFFTSSCSRLVHDSPQRRRIGSGSHGC